jgi:formylmethanofuran dehydrogenase subunit B
MPSPDGGLRRATCAGCGTGCDDLQVGAHDGAIERLERSCPVGDKWFDQHSAPDAPVARIDGAEAELAEALRRAAEILGQARMPLVYGLGQASCEAQREAVAIAEAIGAVVDTAVGATAALAYQARGASTATLGEIRDRAQSVVVWRADPATTHPRLLGRLHLDRSARAPSRALVVVGSQRNPTAQEAEVFIELAGERDFEALWALRAMVREAPLAREHVDPLPWEALEALAQRLRDASNVAFLYDARLGLGGDGAVRALQALVRDLNALQGRPVHAVTAHLRREGNAAGAEAVLSWQTGYSAAVSFMRGYPRANADEFSAPGLLAAGDIDAALVVGADPLEHLPPAAAHGLREIPIVSIDSRDTQTAQDARVAFTTAAAGLHSPGTTQRLDGVPLALRAPLATQRPGEDELLGELASALARRGGHRTAGREA